MEEKIINVIFFGAPGAGKGTQAKKLSNKLTLPHIDTGNLIRKAISNGTELGQKAKQFVESGKLVPDDLIIDLIKERLNTLLESKLNGFILDGFPRTVPQADALHRMLGDLALKLTAVLNITAPKSLLIERLSSRRLCSNKNCGAIYNLISHKPKVENKCDICNTELYQRKDDSEEATKERLLEYQNKTAPLEKYYRDLNLICDIDGTKNENEVYNEIEQVLRILNAIAPIQK